MQMWQRQAQSWCRCGSGRPNHGADVAALIRVPARMLQGKTIPGSNPAGLRVRSRCRCDSVEPSTRTTNAMRSTSSQNVCVEPACCATLVRPGLDARWTVHIRLHDAVGRMLQTCGRSHRPIRPNHPISATANLTRLICPQCRREAARQWCTGSKDVGHVARRVRAACRMPVSR